jgi:hypothetical protein
MTFTLVTVEGRYLTPLGEPAAGAVSFVLSHPLQDASTDEIVGRVKAWATLDEEGYLTVELVATDDPSSAPSGVTYLVEEHIGVGKRSYAIEVPHTTPPLALQLADVAPAITQPLYSYTLISTFNAHAATIASGATLGHVRVGTGLAIDGSGVLSVVGGGSGFDKTYVHNQVSAATVWHVSHLLGKRPSVIVVDSALREVIGDVTYIDDDHIDISFGVAFSGKAYIN